MKVIYSFILIGMNYFIPFSVFGQTPVQNNIQTKEIKLNYTNGKEVFRICITNPQLKFDDNQEYFWFTEFSKIKSTKGGAGGNLLHGNYKLYDEKGNLRQEKNYYLGLKDGKDNNWDSLGNITSIFKYKKGDCVYMKFKEGKYWVELFGVWLLEGSIKKCYTEYNTLISEETYLKDNKEHVKTFYEFSGKLNEDYYLRHGEGHRVGKYICYYENGKIQTEGQFYDGEWTDIKDGTWKFYKLNGTLKATELYKTEIKKFDNGELKSAGGYIFNSIANEWAKTGEWRWFKNSDNGDGVEEIKNYEWGVEVSK